MNLLVLGGPDWVPTPAAYRRLHALLHPRDEEEAPAAVHTTGEGSVRCVWDDLQRLYPPPAAADAAALRRWWSFLEGAGWGAIRGAGVFVEALTLPHRNLHGTELVVLRGHRARSYWIPDPERDRRLVAGAAAAPGSAVVALPGAPGPLVAAAALAGLLVHNWTDLPREEEVTA